MRFSSNAPTTPTTTTSIDLIDGKRGSCTAAAEQPIQVVEIDHTATQQHLNGNTMQHNSTHSSISDDICDIGSLKVQEIINASCDYTESPPPMHDNNGNV